MGARILRLSLLVAAALLAPACGGGARPWQPIERALTVDELDERTIGDRFDQEILSGGSLVRDPEIHRFVHDLGHAILDGIEPQPHVYRFRVIEDPSLNAFAVPGGYVYFHSGTLLQANSIDEVAGVMAHEIAHVKGRHYKRLREASRIPDLLAGIGGLATAVATGESGALVVAQGANVAIRLQFTREVEAEADGSGAVFMSRAGYSPEGMARFFDRLALARESTPAALPPYLYSHPDADSRRDRVRALADDLAPQRPPPADLARRFDAMQVRLARLIESDRIHLAERSRPRDAARSDFFFDRAVERANDRDIEGAIRLLQELEPLTPSDPRVPLELGDLHEKQGQPERAFAAFQRATALDPANGYVQLRAGRAAWRLGRRGEAAFHIDQARFHLRAGTGMRARAEAWNRRLAFPMLPVVGIANADVPRERWTAPANETHFGSDESTIAWWGRVAREREREVEALTIRWRDPDGTTAAETRPRWDPERGIAFSELAVADLGRGAPEPTMATDGANTATAAEIAAAEATKTAPGDRGPIPAPTGSHLGPHGGPAPSSRGPGAPRWSVEAWLDGSIVDRQEFAWDAAIAGW